MSGYTYVHSSTEAVLPLFTFGTIKYINISGSIIQIIRVQSLSMVKCVMLIITEISLFHYIHGLYHWFHLICFFHKLFHALSLD